MSECGDQFFLRDVNGANLTRFIWQCRGRWVALQSDTVALDHPLRLPNGTMGDWRWLLGYLLVAARLSPDGIEYSTDGPAHLHIQLRRVMRVSDMSALLGVPEADIRAELSDYIIQVSDESG